MQNKLAQVALRTSLLYGFIAGLWILMSDRLVVSIVSDPANMSRLQTYKGLVFVMVTALLLYAVLRGQLRRWEKEAAGRVTAEEALRQSEAKYRFLAENTGDVIWLYDLKANQLTYVNPSVSRLFGFTPEEVVGKNLEELLTSTSLSLVRERLPERIAAFEGGDESARVQTREVDHPHKNRSRVSTEVVTTLLQNTEGRVTQILGVSRDITERKRVAESMRENEERLRLFIEHAPVSLAMFDQKMHYLSASRRWLSDYNLGERDLTGLSHYEVFPEIPEYLKAIHRRGLSGEVVRSESDRFERADGTVQWLRWEVRPWRDQAGNIGGIVIFSEDITARMQAAETLRESEALYHDLVETSQDLIWQCDAEGRYTYLNPAWEEVLGYKIEEMLGRPFTHFQSPEQAKHDRAVFSGLLAGTTIKGHETIHLRKDGTPIHLVFNAKCVQDKDGSFIGTRGTAYDITERKQASEALQRSIEEARRLAHENSMIADIGRIIGSTLNIHEVYERFAGDTQKLIPFDRISIGLVNPPKKTVTIAYTAGPDVPDRRVGTVIPFAGSITEKVMQTRIGVIYQAKNKTEREGQVPDFLTPFPAGFQSMLVTPLISKDTVIGALFITSRKPGAFTDRDLNLAELVGAQIAGAIANSELFSEWKRIEEALRESESRFRTLIESVPLPIVIARGGDLSYANPAFCHLMGVGSSDLFIHTSLLNFIASEKKEEVRRYMDMLKKGEGASVIHESMGIKTDGTRFPCEINMTQVKLSDGEALLAYLYDLTDRKRGEEALQKSEGVLRNLLEATPVGVALLVDRIFVKVNTALCRITGYSETEMIGMSTRILYPDDETFTGIGKALYRQMEREGLGMAESHLKRKDRTLIDVLICLSPFDPKDAKAGVTATVLDITERKQAERLIQTQHDLALALSSVTRLAEGLRLCLDAALRISGMDCGGIYLHDETTGALDLCIESGLGEDFIRNVSHCAADSMKTRFVMEGKPIYTKYERMGFPLSMIDRKEGLLALSVLPIHHLGCVIGCLNVASHVLDEVPVFSRIALEAIAAQIGSSIVRLKAEETLRARQAQLDSIIRNTPDIIYRLDPEGKITFVSEAVTRYGYAPEDMIDKHIMEFVHPEDQQKVLHRINERRKGIRSTKGLEVRLFSKDKKVVTFEANAKTIGEETIFMIDAEGLYDSEASKPVFLGTQGIARDITQRIRAEREKEELLKQLQQVQKMEAIGTLAGGIAHDFNNILSGIIGYTELALMEEKTSTDKKRQGHLSRVLEAGHRAKDLVQQILQFSRRDSSTMHPIPITPIIKESIKLLRSTLPTTIDIQQQIQVDSDRILGDPTQVHQVMMNLCTNAYHAMREHGGVLTITLENVSLQTPREFMSLKVPPGDYIKLSIADTGHGIPPQIFERIFEPYFTTKKVTEGTGLGLSVTMGIVKSHSGLITVESEVGKGTRFDIFFPVVQAKPSEDTPTVHATPAGSRERILIVDDEPFFLDVVKENLEALNYRVVANRSSLKTLEDFKANPEGFDLVVTDQTMPEMTGVQLVGEIRKLNPDIPIILCTGYSETVSEQSARYYGIAKFLLKPVTFQDLAWAVYDMFHRKG